MIYILLLLFIILAGMTWGLIESTTLKVDHHNYVMQQDRWFHHSQKRCWSMHYPNQPETTGLRIALITDIHGYFFNVRHRKICRTLQRIQPDLVLFGGDLSTWVADRPYGIRRLEAIAQFCQKNNWLFAGVYGNHDMGLQDDPLKSLLLPLMENQSLIWTDKKGREWQILGLADLHTRKPDLEKAITNLIYPHTPPLRPVPAKNRFVLSHNPDVVLQLDIKDAAFLLSGHFHGGQIRLPFRLEYKTLRKDALCKLKIYQHQFEYGGIQGYISNGIGCVLLPFRFLVPPEISVLEYL